MQFQILIFIIQLHLSLQHCIDSNKEPIIFGEIQPCPFYNNKPVCCRQSDIEKMTSNYLTIDATFGSAGGGWDICGANLKRFWCIYTCDPNQSDFMQNKGKVNVTNPSDKNKLLEVDLIDLQLTPQVACEVYSSCSRTSFVTQVSAMQTPGGFFQFQGEQGITQGGQYITFQFNVQNSLQMENIWSCNTKSNITTIDDNGIIHYWDPYGYEIQEECGCNTCDKSCDANLILYEPTGVFYGFEKWYVLSVWLFVLTFSLAVTLWRKLQLSHLSELRNKEQLIQTMNQA